MTSRGAVRKTFFALPTKTAFLCEYLAVGERICNCGVNLVSLPKRMTARWGWSPWAVKPRRNTAVTRKGSATSRLIEKLGSSFWVHCRPSNTWRERWSIDKIRTLESRLIAPGGGGAEGLGFCALVVYRRTSWQVRGRGRDVTPYNFVTQTPYTKILLGCLWVSKLRSAWSEGQEHLKILVVSHCVWLQ